MNNHHYSLPITRPNAANQVDYPWILPHFMNHRTSPLNSYGPSSYGFSFRNPYPSLLDRFSPTQSHPMMNPLAIENSQPSFVQTNYNGFLPTGNGHELGHFFQQPSYISNISLLVDYLRNLLSIILMGEMSLFDHSYGGYYNNPPGVNLIDYYGNFIGGESWNNGINPMQEDERRKYRCVDCGKGFPTTNALGGHRSSHSKMRKKEALRMRIAEELAANNAENSAGPSAIRDRPLELEDEVMPSAPPLKIRKIE